MAEHVYKIRYMVQDWNKPRENQGKQVLPNVRVSDTNYGYADSLFVVSIMNDDAGNPASFLLLDSETMGMPSREMLLQIRAQIDHCLKEHSDA